MRWRAKFTHVSLIEPTIWFCQTCICRSTANPQHHSQHRPVLVCIGQPTPGRPVAANPCMRIFCLMLSQTAAQRALYCKTNDIILLMPSGSVVTSNCQAQRRKARRTTPAAPHGVISKAPQASKHTASKQVLVREQPADKTQFILPAVLAFDKA